MRLAPSPGFTARTVSVPGGRAGALHTVARMREHVEKYRRDPAILQLAVTLIHQNPQFDQDSEAASIFDFVRAHIRYVRDPVGIESLADPVTTLRRQVGDCDDQSTLLASLFESVGYPTRFVLAGYASEDFEHVYLDVLLRDEWVSCDPTMTVSMGWSPDSPLVMWIEER
jgi:hypothetical protein